MINSITLEQYLPLHIKAYLFCARKERLEIITDMELIPEKTSCYLCVMDKKENIIIFYR